MFVKHSHKLFPGASHKKPSYHSIRGMKIERKLMKPLPFTETIFPHELEFPFYLCCPFINNLIEVYIGFDPNFTFDYLENGR